MSREAINIGNIQGQQELRNQASELLYEIMKIFSIREEEIIETMADVLSDPEKLYMMTPYLDKKIPGLAHSFSALNKLVKHYLIITQPNIPPGLVSNTNLALIKYRTILTEIIMNFKKSDVNIIHDIGLQIQKTHNRKSQVEKGNGGMVYA